MHPDIPVVGFPRGVGATGWYVFEAGVDGIRCDTATPPFVMSEVSDEEDVATRPPDSIVRRGWFAAPSPKFFLERAQFLIRAVFKIDKFVARVLRCRNEFVELELNSSAFAILRVLYEKDRKKGEDRRRRINDELPRVRVIEEWTRHRP
jgi:hypothetical protein